LSYKVTKKKKEIIAQWELEKLKCSLMLQNKVILLL